MGSLVSSSAFKRTQRALQALIGLVVINVIFLILAPSYRQVANFTTILSNATVLGCLAAGSTIVIISGGLDLSIGSIIALVSVVVGYMLMVGMPVYLAVLAGLGTGALCGLISGLLIVSTGIPSFIGTLGMMMAVRGVAEIIGAGKDMSAFPASFSMLGTGTIVPVAIMAAAFIIVGVFLTQMRLGFNAFAIGGNAEVARLSGISVKRNQVLYYLLGGLFAGLAAVIETSRLDFAQSSRGAGQELNSIAAVIIGGTTMAGGMGGVGRTVIGVLIMTSLTAGLSHLGIGSSWQRIAIGIVIILAVWIDTYQRQRAAKA
jgi:ribose/xylose/arabinose/galactoside ABC-type transport system permease subunit